MFNEYGKTGSAFPSDEQVLDSFIGDNDEQNVEVKDRLVPWRKHMLRSFYVTLLAVMIGEYPQQVVSLGGKITLLGIGFFILTIVAVYTANLSALLVAEIRFGRVETLNQVVANGQRICATREVMEDVVAIHHIGESMFVSDPVEQGGDGKPGFACSSCAPRRRVFDFLDADAAKKEDSGPTAKYCHVALVVVDDLDLMKHEGVHCNKTLVGPVIASQTWGLPVFEKTSTELTSLMLQMKNGNVLAKFMEDKKPEAHCEGLKITVADETAALNITQLMGIWVVAFGFAICGLCITFIRPHFKKRSRRRQGHHIHTMARYDQSGQRISRMEHGHSALTKTLNSDMLDLTGRGGLRSFRSEEVDSDTSPVSHDLSGFESNLSRHGVTPLSAELSGSSRRKRTLNSRSWAAHKKSFDQKTTVV